MGDTDIEWTHLRRPDGTVLRGKVWNPTTGCDQVSPGCARCYAKTIARRFWATQYPPVVSEGCAIKTRPRVFEDVQIHPERLAEPLSWAKPCGVFVNSMSDLFHVDIPDTFIAAVLGVIWSTPRHQYFILTKRIERIPGFLERLAAEAKKNGFENRIGEFCAFLASRLFQLDVRDEQTPVDDEWPPRNLRIGPSIENQRFADQRFPVVCALGEAGWNTMVSLEPLLGPVTIPERYLVLGRRAWAVCGGESGPNARVHRLEWVRSLLAQCHGRIAVFVKQLGANPYQQGGQFSSFMQWVNKASTWLGGRVHRKRRVQCIDARGRHLHNGGHFMRARDENTFPVTFHFPVKLKSGKGAAMHEWTPALQVRQVPPHEEARA